MRHVYMALRGMDMSGSLLCLAGAKGNDLTAQFRLYPQDLRASRPLCCLALALAGCQVLDLGDGDQSAI